MCIIAIKGYNADYPSADKVNAMCKNNPDGFALAYYTATSGFQVYRTMKKNKFLAKYKEVMATYEPKEIGLFIHARIGTHGSININNCHGWTDEKTGLCFAHNGILSIDNREDMTDSETFFRDLFMPAYELGGWDAADRAVRACIGTSKFVFIDSHGTMRYYGQYIKESDGCMYSNGTYVDWSSYYTPKKSKKGKNKCEDYYDDYYDDYYNRWSDDYDGYWR
jgi:predicted glutamine amidotransferase